jgi:hypothetical protein
MKTLALAGFAAMWPSAVAVEDSLLGVHRPADVIEAVLTACPHLVDLNCSETDIGAGAIANSWVPPASEQWRRTICYPRAGPVLKGVKTQV